MGYDAARVRGWVETLDFSEERLAADELYVVEVEARVVGWCEVVPPLDGACVLEHLWIEPEWIGRELGSALFEFAAQRARALGARLLEWEAEPTRRASTRRWAGAAFARRQANGGARSR